jgi:flagellin-specific chaperone FliS
MKDTAIDHEKYTKRIKMERATQMPSVDIIVGLTKLLKFRVVVSRAILKSEEGSESYEELLKLYDHTNKEINLILAI